MDSFSFVKIYSDLADKLIDWQIEYELGQISKMDFIHKLDLMILEASEPPGEIIDLALKTKASDAIFMQEVEGLLSSVRVLNPRQQIKLLSEFITAMRSKLNTGELLNIFRRFIRLCWRYFGWNSNMSCFAVMLESEIDEWEYISTEPFETYLYGLRDWALGEAQSLLKKQSPQCEKNDGRN